MRPNVRVLCLTKYGRLGASSRLRTLQFLPWLQQRGLELTLAPLLSDNYVSDLYRGKTDWNALIRGYSSRIRRLLVSRQFDVLWLEKEALPWVPEIIESMLTPSGIPLVVDYDDAIFHHYDRHRRPIVRRLLGRKIDGVMARAHTVMAGNPYLADRARAAGARRVEIVPTVVDLARYDVREAPPGALPVIGWIGTPGTAKFLGLIEDALARCVSEGLATVVAVGINRQPLASVYVQPRVWSEESEVSEIQNFDIGVMPLPDEPFERGKCGYKLIQYMACGKPVVASPVGVNTEIVRDGKNGFLASDSRSWLEALMRLTSDADLRRRMGQDGRVAVEERYCLDVAAPRVEAILRKAAAG